MKHLIILLFILFPYLLSGQQIREIPVNNLSDIAIASYDRMGPVIYYNPTICAQVGPLLSAYFKAHEYGHHYLGHIQREHFESNIYDRTWLRREYEKEADCWASKNVSFNVRNAAFLYFTNMQANTRPTWLHPTGYERALVIRNCSL